LQTYLQRLFETVALSVILAHRSALPRFSVPFGGHYFFLCEAFTSTDIPLPLEIDGEIELRIDVNQAPQKPGVSRVACTIAWATTDMLSTPQSPVPGFGDSKLALSGLPSQSFASSGG
jgi:hypothetical protein